MNWNPTHPTQKQLIHVLRAETSELYLVGGAVRDWLLQTPHQGKDLDFVIAEPALAVAKRAADRLGWAYYVLDESREIARILFTDGGRTPYICDIARMRGGSIEADLRARDFTVNALAVGWKPSGQTELIDICGGQADLRRGTLRRVSPTGLAEDAIRVLRAPRFLAQLGFSLDPDTEVQIMRLARTLQLVKPERIREELWKALATERPVHGLLEMRRLGLLPHVLPELAATDGVEQSYPHHLDVYLHTLKTVENAKRIRSWLFGHAHDAPFEANETEESLFQTLAPWRYRLRQLFGAPVAAMRTRADWLLWLALFHDVGKPATRTATALATDILSESAAAHSEELPDGHDNRRIRFLGHEEVGADLTARRLGKLRFSRHEISLAQRAVLAHMRPHHLYNSFTEKPISRRAAYRFFRDATLVQARQTGSFDALLLALCDYPAIHQATPPPKWDTYLRRISELFAFGFEQIEHAAGQHAPLVDGRMLMRHFNLKPGPHIGEMLERLHEAQIAGEIDSVEDALAFAAHDLSHRTRMTA